MFHARGKNATILNTNSSLELGSSKIVPLDCVDRANSSLGSSQHDSAEQDLSYKEILSHEPEVNPVFHDWNIVFARYCDGSSWMGNVSEPIEIVNGTSRSTYYVRGSVNMLGIVGTLLAQHGMGEAEEVVLHGCSVGAQASLVMGDHIRAALPEHISFAVIADSGAMLLGGHPFAKAHESVWFRYLRSVTREVAVTAEAMGQQDLAQRMYEIVDANTIEQHYLDVFRMSLQHFHLSNFFAHTFPVSRQCQKWTMERLGLAPEEATCLCQTPTFGIAFSEVPLFVLNSIYDSWSNYQTEADRYEDCVNSARCIQVGSVLAREFEAQFEWAFQTRWRRQPGVPLGAFLDACSHHCKMWNQLTGADNRTNAQHVGAWLDGVRRWHSAKRTGRKAWDSHKHKAIHWQRRGAEFPCTDCCA